tara:strand:- start:296 stop:622 length:327 start_codon:yes stop_codon:yes gene_type:complete
MAINSDVNIPAVLDYLNKKPEMLGLSASNPPHTINVWEGGDAKPTDEEINKGWTDYKAAQAAIKYKTDRADAYPSIGDQLDMQYWDKKNGTTTWVDAIAKVKADNPKP